MGDERAARYEESRRRLLEPPRRTPLNATTPLSSPPIRAQASTLDSLPHPGRSLQNGGQPSSPTSSTLGARSGHVLSQSNDVDNPLLDNLLQGLWDDQVAALEDLNRLEDAVARASNIELPLSRGRRLTSSPFPNTRATGYSLLEFITKHHGPLSQIWRRCIWILVHSFGSEQDELPRRRQMGALNTLIGPHGNIVGLNGAIAWILDGINSLVSPSGTLIDTATFAEYHKIIRNTITHNIGQLQEDQIHEILDVYCYITSQLAESTWQNANAPPLEATITLTVAFLVQVVEQILEQELIPELALGTLVQTLCLVLGLGGESKPSAFGTLSQSAEDGSNESYRCAARTVLRLLCDTLYRLPVLEALEGILGYSSDQSPIVRIGAINAVCERVWSELVAHFQDGSHDAVRSEQRGIPIHLDDEFSLLQEIPDKWNGQPTSDALFTRLLKGVTQFLNILEFETSSCVRHFLSRTISRTATLVTQSMNSDGSPYLLAISQQPGYTPSSSSPLLKEIETLLGMFFRPGHFPVFLTFACLTMFRHLHDHDLIVAVMTSQDQLSPVHDDWLQYFDLCLEIYRETAQTSPASRQEIISSVEECHEAVVDCRDRHPMIQETLVHTLEETLPGEHDEHILQSVFRILSREVVAIVSGDHSAEQVHTLLNRICNGWIHLACSRCRCGTQIRENNLEDQSIIEPSSSGCSRKTLAANFLVDSFNKVVSFNGDATPLHAIDPNLLRVLSAFCCSLFERLVDLIRPQSGWMGKPHISCANAQLVILGWMLRIRANSDHRVFVHLGDLLEVVPFARIVQRVGIPTESISPGLPNESNAQQPYWHLPEFLTSEHTESVTRPSRILSTSSRNESMNQRIELPIHLYLSTIADLILHGQDWEIVSYILTYLPVQLSNKHLFYGRETNRSLRRLVVAICESIKNDELYNRMRNMNPPELPKSSAQAILYQSLTVLLGYHNWLEPLGPAQNKEPNLNSMMVDYLVHGLSGGIETRTPCLEALSLAVYSAPEQISKRSAIIIGQLATFATNPFNSLQILEYLIAVGYTPKVHIGIFREEDYCRVFGLALMYIQQYSRLDVTMITTPDGKESYALAQHVYRISFMVFYVWFVSMKLADRAKFVPFIVKGLQEAHDQRTGIELARGKRDPAIEVCLDWLLQNTYGNTDPVPWSWFMYSSIAFPGYGSRDIPSDREQRRKAQMENVAEVKAWKLGNAIMVVSVMKYPVGWARIVVHRAAGRMELFCHVEKVRRWVPLDAFNGPFDSIDTSEKGEGGTPDEKGEGVTPDEEKGEGVAPDEEKGEEGTPTGSDYEGAIRSLMMPALFNSRKPYDTSQLRAYSDVEKLRDTLFYLHHTPVVDPHRVGVLYVAPGQTREEDILSNTHGSLTYAHFLSRLTQVVDLTTIDEKVFARGLESKRHGRYTRAWMDDIAAINFHVATMMPNIGDNTSKKGPIGNDAVKIVWNDGGRPYAFGTFKSAFNLINIVIEPESPAPNSACRTSLDDFLRITLQVAPGMPRPTPIGDFKMVRLEYLPGMMRHFSLFACLLCESWTGTDGDGMERTPLETNWTARLACIERSEKYLEREIARRGC